MPEELVGHHEGSRGPDHHLPEVVRAKVVNGPPNDRYGLPAAQDPPYKMMRAPGSRHNQPGAAQGAVPLHSSHSHDNTNRHARALNPVSDPMAPRRRAPPHFTRPGGLARKESVPRASDRLLLKREMAAGRGDPDAGRKNHVKDNMMKVILDNSAMVKRQQAQQKDEQSKQMELHKNYGKVPRYVQRYDKEREDQHI